MAAKVLTITTHKGGDGKTQFSIGHADYSAIVNEDMTLIIDLDAQANSSSNYLPMERDPAAREGMRPPVHPDYNPQIHTDWDENGRTSIADIFYGKALYPFKTRFPKLEIIPAFASKLKEAERVTKSDVAEKIHERLKKFIQLPQIQDRYKLIIIDTPPAKGPLTTAALRACTHMLVPTLMEKFSIDGLYGIMQLWKQESLSRPHNDPIELIGFVANKFKKNFILHKQFYEGLKSNESINKFLLDQTVAQRIAYAELLVKDKEKNESKSIFELGKNDTTRKEFEAVCEVVMRRIYCHD